MQRFLCERPRATTPVCLSRTTRCELPGDPMLELPATMDEVTADWLQAAVGAHPDFAGTRIEYIDKTPIGVGIGQIGDLARITLTYADAGAGERKGPVSVVLKLQAGFEPMRAVGVRYDMYLRETGFYQTLAKVTRAPTPTVYFIDWRPAQERNTLVMQDLTAWHWPDQVAGATPQQAERCIDAIAQVAAGHWDVDFAGHDWLPGSLSAVFQRIVGDYKLCVPVSLDRLRDFLTPAQADACQRIALHFDWLMQQLAEGPQVLTHVDCRLENFVFDTPDAGRLALIDWQLVSRLRPGFDFAYFIGTSLDEGVRRAIVPALTVRYLDALRANGVQHYDDAAFAHDFRLGTMAMTMIPVIGGASFDVHNPRSVQLFGAMMSRAFASVLEYDCMALLPGG